MPSSLEHDHAFDAFLCALTAMTHHFDLTQTWKEAGIEETVVDLEGHILLLKPQAKNP